MYVKIKGGTTMATVNSYVDYKIIFSVEKKCGNCRYYVEHFCEVQDGICVKIFCGHCMLKNCETKKPSETCELFTKGRKK